jgi:uncharacterized protein (TIGR02145 family)
MELLSDGTGIVTYEKAFKEAGAAITWKTENGRFYMTASGVASASGYKLQGSLLTFTEDNGKVSEYTKCHKDCQEAVKEYTEAEEAKAEAEFIKAEKARAKAEAAEAEAAVASFKAKAKGVKKGSFTDARDSKKYKTVKLDNKTWMAENLNFNADGSKCYYNSESNCQKYGRLYNLSTAKAACPSGWHLPSDAEWQELVDFAGGREIAGNILKASSGWNDDYEGKSGNGVDVFGFSALPGGFGNSNGGFGDVGISGGWCSSTEYDTTIAYFRNMDRNSTKVHRYPVDKALLLRSVRCVQD